MPYDDWRIKHRIRFNRLNRKFQQSRRELVREIKAGEPCCDCGKYFPHYQLQFDHIYFPRRSHVSKHVGSIAGILAEMMLCDIVCANCHAKRTWERRENAKTQH